MFFLKLQRDDQHILTACQDRNIRVYAVENGKHAKTFKGSQSEDGTLIKVCILGIAKKLIGKSLFC